MEQLQSLNVSPSHKMLSELNLFFVQYNIINITDDKYSRSLATVPKHHNS